MDGDSVSDINLDLDEDEEADVNVDVDYDDIPDVNIDTNGDNIPDVNVDTDGDNTPDINIDTNGDGMPDINIDTDGDGKADINVYTNGDRQADLNLDVDGDAQPDEQIDADHDGVVDQGSLVAAIVPLSAICLAEAGLLIYQILIKLKKRKLFSVVPVFMLGIFPTGQIVTTAILSVFMIGMAAANIVLFFMNRKQKQAEEGSTISENSMAPVTDDNDSSLDFETEELEGTGVEVIAVAWPEHPDRLYCYDPNGHKVRVGDVVLVPSRMLNRSYEIQREATVIRGNYRVEPETIHYPLKKIVCVVKRKS